MTENNYNTIKPTQQLPLLSRVSVTRDRKDRNASGRERKKSEHSLDRMNNNMEENTPADGSENHPPQNDTEEHCIDFCA